MREGVEALTEREKQTLRLLVRGHEAKSIARTLGLSVHTINERLREARRKLGVSSSREAARILAGDEQADPQKTVDEPYGLAAPAADGPSRRGADHRLLWLTGGMLVMALVTAALALALAGGRLQPARVDTTPDGAGATLTRARDPAALQAARAWLALIDDHAWEASWRATSTFFRSKVTAQGWAAMAQRVNEPLGRAASRQVRSDTATDDLPGAPAGRYEVVQFDTDFTRKAGVVETVVLVRQDEGWRVTGYFIRGAEQG